MSYTHSENCNCHICHSDDVSIQNVIEDKRECINRAAIFIDDVMPQIGKLCIQDYDNLNRLLILIRKCRTNR